MGSYHLPGACSFDEDDGESYFTSLASFRSSWYAAAGDNCGVTKHARFDVPGADVEIGRASCRERVYVLV